MLQTPLLGQRAANVNWLKSLVALACVIGGILVVHFATVQHLVDVWSNNTTYNYAFLIAPISAYLIWQRREALLAEPPQISTLGFLSCVGFSSIWLIADAAEISQGRHIALVGLILSAVWAVVGTRACRRMLFPLLYLWLMVPTGEFLQPWLQSVTALISGNLIAWTGIPIWREGLYIEVPSGTYLVAVACSGLNFLLASLALSLVYGNLFYTTPWKRVAAVVVALAVSLVANWLRVWSIIVFNHFTGGGLDIGGDHLIWGWGFFAAITLGMIVVGNLFVEPAADEQRAAAPLPASTGRNLIGISIACLAAIGLSRWYAEYTAQHQPAGIFKTSIEVPKESVPLTSESIWRPVLIGADVLEHKSYDFQRSRVETLVGWYGRQENERKLIGEQNSLVNKEGFNVINQTVRDISLDGRTIPVRQIEIRHPGGRMMIWYWYRIDDKDLVSTAQLKIWQAKSRLLMQEGAAAVYALAASSRGDLASAEAALQQFAAATRLVKSGR